MVYDAKRDWDGSYYVYVADAVGEPLDVSDGMVAVLRYTEWEGEGNLLARCIMHVREDYLSGLDDAPYDVLCTIRRRLAE